MRKIKDNNEGLTNTENSNVKDEPFDKKLSKCLKNCNLFDTEIKQNKVNKNNKKKGFFSSEKEYQNSFENII